MSIYLKKENHTRHNKSVSPDRYKGQLRQNQRNPNDKKLSVIDEIDNMKHRREERQRKKDDDKRAKLEMKNNPDYIAKLDYDYEKLIRKRKVIVDQQQPEDHTTSEASKIFVCVRKRPIFPKEILNGEIDCITAINPKLCVYDCKMKIDGFTKYIDINDFYFDNVFNENEDTNALYECSIKPTIKLLLKGGIVTCFAYGQTGSGKTFTMKGIQDSAIDSLFEEFSKHKNQYDFYVSFFEIYIGKLCDLLNDRKEVKALEDKNQKVQIFGLEERQVTSPEEMRMAVEDGNKNRTTHNTVTNETSSRSHAICNFVIRERGKEGDEYAKLTLVDLAGSERATETQSNNKSRLAEGAEINKSLLALKECIRGLDSRKTSGNSEQHVPFRTSKLTLVLRDSFISKMNMSKIIMISCVSPGYSSANHTINTLRYSDRLKEKTSQMAKNYKQINTNGNNEPLDFKAKDKDKDKENHYSQSHKNNEFSNSNSNNIQRLNNNYMNNNNKISFALNDEIEDDMQKLNLNPTPITKPIEGLHKVMTITQTNVSPIPIPHNNNNNNNSNNNKGKNISSTAINNQVSSPRKHINSAKDVTSASKINNTISTISQKKHEPKTKKPKQNNWAYLKEANEEKKIEDNRKCNEQLEAYVNDDDNDDFFNEKANEPIPDLLEEQDKFVDSHMTIIKNEARLLTESGTIISNIKNSAIEMEEYTMKLENNINLKLENYQELKKLIHKYKEMANTKVGGWNCK